MLILERTLLEEVVIRVPGRTPIVVSILKVGEKRVKLGFAADADVEILRSELVEDTITRSAIREVRELKRKKGGDGLVRP
jgi:sRNA-binding carbon storage regulator CsrA